MLQLQVYSERTINKNGITTRVGEDALPFVNNAGMFVADGMGGGAGVPIISFNSNCFKPEKLSELICDNYPIKEREIKDFFAEYIKQNFSSLSNPVMKELYEEPKKNSLRLKKSGYVGSHALGTVMTFFLLSISERLNDYSYEEWEQVVRDYHSRVFTEYKAVIELLEAECAKVSIDKIDYYGTTLSGVFFREGSEYVDAIFWNCGDSRSYVWDDKGFRQASDDQGRNGGMTSRFSLGKETNTEVSLEVKRYAKPCSFICMTDGFYNVFGGKNGFHSSPLYMEGFLMNVLRSADSISGVQQRLKAMFDAKGQIDDSNSMVMAAFGYASYEELRDAAFQRFTEINNMYHLEEMPDDFLLCDYAKIVESLQKSSADSVMPLLDEAYLLESIHSYCVEQINRPENFDRYHNEIREIQAKIQSVDDLANKTRQQLYTIGRSNFIDFVDTTKVGQTGVKKFLDNLSDIVSSTRPEDAIELGRDYWAVFQNRTNEIAAIRNILKIANDEVCRLAATIDYSVEVPWTSSCEQSTLNWTRDTRDYISKVQNDIRTSLSRIESYGKTLTDDYTQWTNINNRIFQLYLSRGGRTTVADVVDGWVASTSNIESVLPSTTIPSVRNTIIKLVGELQKHREEKERLYSSIPDAKERAAHQYWKDMGHTVIRSLLKSDFYFMDNIELRQRIEETLSQNKELQRYQDLYEKQTEAFQKYLELHLSEVSEDKRADVEKNGWM